MLIALDEDVLVFGHSSPHNSLLACIRYMCLQDDAFMVLCLLRLPRRPAHVRDTNCVPADRIRHAENPSFCPGPSTRQILPMEHSARWADAEMRGAGIVQ